MEPAVDGAGANRAAADGAGAEGRYYVLLTNRVHPSRDPRRFPAVRRAFHHHAAALARPVDTFRIPAPGTGPGSASTPVGQ
ncbi:beta-lactamase [Streptomyces iranensis]|uniref:Beta-lactamase n=1 Tax=Streptomyces iranensis TaxID=576784 RepID=A0A061A621_9ACTN|nr:beta-lactamase [Streptomyces iranensis]